MARVVRFPTDEVDGLDEEFLYHLGRGADHLARGEPEAARAALAQAAKMRPRDPKVLGLLGQACYRLERFADAAEAYGLLVQETPLEPGAQVNLGLALLKAGRASDAITHLERALDLNPEHRRAMAYLGLAWMKQGNVARAREWFERAGREQMVAKCDALLRGTRPDREREPEREPEQESAPVGDGWKVVVASASGRGAPAPADDGDDVQDAIRALEPPRPAAPPPREPAAAAPLPASKPTPAPAPAPKKAPRAASAPTPAPPAAPPTPEPVVAKPQPEPVAAQGGLAGDLAAAQVLPPAAGTFSVTPGVALRVAVAGEVLVRLDGLLALEGHVEVAPESKRLRGRSVQESFGTGRAAMQRARGRGVLVFGARERRYTALDLAGGAAHFREDAVFAFEGSLQFENGRLAAPGAPEIELVRLCGPGAVLVGSRGELAALEVVPDRPIRVAAAALVGWAGTLTPRLLPLARVHADADAVELAGEGRVILDPHALLA